MTHLPNPLRLPLWISLLLARTLVSAQEPPSSSPLTVLEELMTRECQPSQSEGVPLKARAGLEHFKDRLGPWILKKLAALTDGSTEELGQHLSRELEVLATKTPKPEDSFWHPLRFQVDTPEPHPELIAVTARFGIDATLLLFRRGENGWKLLWQDRAPTFDDIDGAFGNYTVVMTPKGTDGAFFLAAGRITPWYQSSWQGAELRVFRIAPDGAVRKIGHREEGIFLGIENPMSLKAQDSQHLVLRLQAASSDPNRHDFPRVFNLLLGPIGLHRVPPYAETPLDLVDEWLHLPWNEAAALTDASALKRLKSLHAHLSNHEENLLTFDEEIKQDTVAGIWEIKAELERDEKIETFVFRVKKAGEDLELQDVLRSKKPISAIAPAADPGLQRSDAGEVKWRP